MLADGSALIALVSRDDRNHRAAVEVVRRRPDARLLLTELIVAEVATLIRARVGADRAVNVAREVLASRRYDVVFVDADLFDDAPSGWRASPTSGSA